MATTAPPISQHERHLRFLRNYFLSTLQPRMVETLTNEGRILGVIVAATVAVLRGASVPPEAVRSYSAITFVLASRTADLMAIAPISEPGVRKLAHCLAIVSRTLDAASASAPASLNDVLNAFPKVGAAVLEKLWRDGEHLLTPEMAFLDADVTRERITELKSKVG